MKHKLQITVSGCSTYSKPFATLEAAEAAKADFVNVWDCPCEIVPHYDVPDGAYYNNQYYPEP
jgi:hypothetical protein